MKSGSLLTAWCLLFGTGCNHQVPDDNRFDVEVRATSDAGRPLQAVRVSSGKLPLGATNASGSFRVRLAGAEGQTLPVTVTCPDGFAFIGPPPELRLSKTRRVHQTRPEPVLLSVTCTKELRDIVVVVHSKGGTALPVLVNGQAQAATDEDGIAHILLQRHRAAEKLSVTLDTSDSPGLRPQSPTRVFELHGRDAILVVDQAFTEAPRASRRPSTTPARHVPYKIQ
jgi:hypothetical protein